MEILIYKARQEGMLESGNKYISKNNWGSFNVDNGVD